MKFLVALSLVVLSVVAFHDKDALVEENRIPKESVAVYGSVCDECQTLIGRIVAVAKDPSKIAELKILLSALCHETSYEEECRLFVSKLDLFLAKLMPYLKDAHHVCVDIHLCNNKKLAVLHRIGLIYAKSYVNKVDGASDLICEECQFAAHELQNVVDNHDTQVQVRRFLSENVCKHLGQYQGSCDILVDDFLPEVFQELHTLLQDPREFCEHIKLCKPTISALFHKHKVSRRVISSIVN